MTSKNEIIDKFYKDPKTGLVGASKLYEKLKDQGITKKDITQYLASQEVHQLHSKTPSVYQRIIPDEIADLLQVDLIDMTDYKRYNQGMGWILNVIDTFSKMVYSQPSKSKNESDVKDAMAKILTSMSKTPKSIQTDSGPEFNNTSWNKLMQDNNIYQFRTSPYTPWSNGGVERFNRTLKEILFKYFDQNNTYKWIDVLQDVVDNYNSSYHSMIEMAPNKVNEKNKEEVQDTYETKLYDSSITNNQKFKIGDLVRLRIELGDFDKAYKQTFTDKIYEIMMYYAGQKGFYYDRYKLKDTTTGKLVRKKYTYFDLVKVPKNSSVVDRHDVKEFSKTVKAAKKSMIELGQSKETNIDNTINVQQNKPVIVPKRLQPANEARRMDAKEAIVGKRISLYWPSVKKWYKGTVQSFDPERQEHVIYYDEAEPDGNHEIYEKIYQNSNKDVVKVKWKYI